jgi:hypothetical protein
MAGLVSVLATVLAGGCGAAKTFGEYRMLCNALWNWRQLGLGTEAPPIAPAPAD